MRSADLADLGLDEGGHLLIDRALAALGACGRLAVTGTHPALRLHLAAWCRAQGHRVEDASVDGAVEGTVDGTVDGTADVTRLAVRDEARHVAFRVAHSAHLARADDRYLGTLRQAVERRHSALRDTAGLNAEVLDALVLLAAGSWSPQAIRAGWEAVRDLQARMDEGRRRRLAYIGFPDDEAAELSALHTRNFM